MGEKVKQGFGKVKNFFGSMSKKVKALLIALLVVILGAVGIVLFLYMNKPYTVLFRELNSEDMSDIVAYLDSIGVSDYRIQNNDTILVPKSQEPSLKMQVLQQGYPSSGFAYETYFDHISSLSSETEQQRLYVYELQDRLGASIRTLDGIQDAHVTIALGEDHRFILNDDDIIEASAGVVVTMQGNQELGKQQAKVIRSLIEMSVPGLSFKNITVSDNHNNLYSGDDSLDASDASELKLAMERKVNEYVTNLLLNSLSPMFGEENLAIGVYSTVDVARVYTDSTTYEEPDWAADGSTNGEGIIGRKIWSNAIIRGDNNVVGGVAGTTTNADLNEYVVNELNPDGTEQEISTSGETDYSVDTHHTQRDSSAGTITDIMVSVGLNSTNIGDVDTVALLSHVARLAGISADVQQDKISILNYPFYESTNNPVNPIVPIGGLPSWAIYALLGGLALLLLLLILILLLRRRAKKKREAEEAARAAEEAAILAAAAARGEEIPQGADIMDIHTEKTIELRKNVRKFAEENPEIAAQMVRSWLKEGEANG